MDPKWKFPDPEGFAVLIDSIKSAKRASDAAASGVSSVEADIQALVENLTNALKGVNSCLQYFDAVKANIAIRKAFTITPDMWEESEELDDSEVAEYPYKCVISIPDSGVDADSRVDVIFDPYSSELAGLCGVCPTSSTAEGTVTIWGLTPPEDNLTGQLYITQGIESLPGSDQGESEDEEAEQKEE